MTRPGPGILPRSAPRSRRPAARLGAALSALALLGAATAVAAPEAESPAEVAGAFQRAVESMDPDALVRHLHPRALARFHATLTMLVETDARGEVLERLLGGIDEASYLRLGPEEALRGVVSSLLEEAPGLVHAMVARDHEIVGVVSENGDTAHVVYRVLPSLQGADPEVRVMTLTRTDAPGRPWGVLRSDELDVLREALRGIPVGLPPPAG